MVPVFARPALAIGLFWLLPGACLLWALRARLTARQSLTAIEWLGLVLALGLGTSSWAALSLAQLGWLGLKSLGAVMLALSAAAAVFAWTRRARNPLGGVRPGPWSEWAAISILLALGLFCLGPPFEDVVGGRDNGSYFGTGLELARTGQIHWDDPIVREIPAEARPLFLPDARPGFGPKPARFAGFYLADSEKGTVKPQGLPLFPIWIALADRVAGTRGALWTSPLFALVALLGVYLAAKRFFSGAVLPAAATAAFLAVDVLEVWFARSHLSEILFQAFFFLGFNAYMAFLDAADESREAECAGPAAALPFALLMLTRMDWMICLPAALVVFGYLRWEKRLARRHLFFWVPFAAVSLHAVLYLAIEASPYTSHLIGWHTPGLHFSHWWRHPTETAAKLAAASALLAFCIIWRRRIAAYLARLQAHPVPVRAGLAAAIILLALYAAFLRPYVSDSPSRANVERLSWYIHPLGFWLGVLGFALFLARRRAGPRLGAGAFAFTSFAMTALFLQHSRINVDQYWEMRRFIAVSVPAFGLFAVFLAWEARRALPRRLGWAGFLAILLPLGVLLEEGSRSLRGHEECEGFLDALGQLDRALSPGALVLTDSRYGSGLAYLSAPLEYLFGRDVLEFQSPQPDVGLLARCLEAFTGRREVVLISTGKTALFTDEFPIEPLGTQRMEWSWMEKPEDRPPSRVLTQTLEVGLWRLGRKGAPPRKPGFVDVGALDDPWVSGFHTRDHGGRRRQGNYRWTEDPEARVYLGTLPAGPGTLFVRLGAPRPQSLGPLEATVGLGGTTLGKVTVEKSFRVYGFETAVAAGGADSTGSPGIVTIGAERWSWDDAVESGYSGDSRHFGIGVDWVAWKTDSILDMDSSEDALFLEHGFYAPEKTHEGRPFRWTSDEASFVLPCVGSGRVTVRASGWRPEGRPPARLEILSGDDVLADESLTAEFREVVFYSAPNGPHTFTLRTNPWLQGRIERGVPAVRELGVRIERISWEPAP